MTPPAPLSTPEKNVQTNIQPGTKLRIDNYDVNVVRYKGQLANQVWYFDVSFKPTDESDDDYRTGLIRVGSAEVGSELSREIAIRGALDGYQMIAPVLAQEKKAVLVLATEVDTTTDPVSKTESSDPETPIAESTDNELPRDESSNNKDESIEATDSSVVQTATASDVLVVYEAPDIKDGTAKPLSAEPLEGSEEKPQPAFEEASEINEDILNDVSSSDAQLLDTSFPDKDADHNNSASEDLDSAESKEVSEDGSLQNQNDLPTEPIGSTEVESSNDIGPGQSSTHQLPADSSTEDSIDKDDDDYLEEEYYDEKDVAADAGGEKLILLSAYPDDLQTLEAWLQAPHTHEENLSVLIQLCQFFRYLHQRDWCFVHFLPQFIQLSKPIQFYDLTGAYASSETLASGLQGPYCAPELSYEKATIRESLSSYAIGSLLYQLTYNRPFAPSEPADDSLKQIPRISQILNICLSPVPEDRFPLSQLLDVLLATRQALRAGTFTWEVAHRSTVGLSTSRLQNEDSYGVRQQQRSNAQAMMLGIVADGMGGVAEGDVASRTAVETFLAAPMPNEMTEDVQQAQWLEALVQTANDAIASTVREGGTTLSAVLAINKTLTLAHVGDSRIYLLRDQALRQISEDHSFVAMLVASGEITHEESLEHPERNVLTKSLGSKRQLASGYIQTMKHWDSSASMKLEDGDILLLCSDGVWDLVKDPELRDIFAAPGSLDTAVSTTIDKVLERGASDNATLLALKLNHKTSSPD